MARFLETIRSNEWRNFVENCIKVLKQTDEEIETKKRQEVFVELIKSLPPIEIGHKEKININPSPLGIKYGGRTQGEAIMQTMGSTPKIWAIYNLIKN